MAGEKKVEVTVADARAFAYRYLGQREHSCKELTDKLSRKGISTAVISEAVEELASEGLVSDQRFAEAFARSRISRLYGPFRIRAELANRGIDSDLAEQTLAPYTDDWIETASQWILKRSEPGQLDRNERARLYRSGTNRGFSHEHMMRAFDAIRARAEDC